MDDIKIKPVYGPGGSSVSLYASHQGRRAGYARLSIAGDHAELIDVNVYHRKGHRPR
jgi:hypothetical protein